MLTHDTNANKTLLTKLGSRHIWITDSSHTIMGWGLEELVSLAAALHTDSSL